MKSEIGTVREEAVVIGDNPRFFLQREKKTEGRGIIYLLSKQHVNIEPFVGERVRVYGHDTQVDLAGYGLPTWDPEAAIDVSRIEGPIPEK